MATLREIWNLPSKKIEDALNTLFLPVEDDISNRIRISINAAKADKLKELDKAIAINCYFPQTMKNNNFETGVNKIVKLLQEHKKTCSKNNFDEVGIIYDPITLEPIDENKQVIINGICYDSDSFTKYLKEQILMEKLPIKDFNRTIIKKEDLIKFEFYVTWRRKRLDLGLPTGDPPVETNFPPFTPIPQIPSFNPPREVNNTITNLINNDLTTNIVPGRSAINTMLDLYLSLPTNGAREVWMRNVLNGNTSTILEYYEAANRRRNENRLFAELADRLLLTRQNNTNNTNVANVPNNTNVANNTNIANNSQRFLTDRANRIIDDFLRMSTRDQMIFSESIPGDPTLQVLESYIYSEANRRRHENPLIEALADSILSGQNSIDPDLLQPASVFIDRFIRYDATIRMEAMNMAMRDFNNNVKYLLLLAARRKRNENPIIEEIINRFETDSISRIQQTEQNQNEASTREPELVNVNLSRQGLTELNQRYFTNLNGNDVEYIDLSENRLTKVDGRIFNNPYKIDDLILGGNPLQEIENIPDVTQAITIRAANFMKRPDFDIRDLKNLSIRGSVIYDFNNIKYGNNLTNIKITKCHIRSLHNCKFPISVVDLDFSDNKISNLTDFSNLINLKKLNLNLNLITYEALLQAIFPENVEYIHLLDNPIDEVDQRFHKAQVGLSKKYFDGSKLDQDWEIIGNRPDYISFKSKYVENHGTQPEYVVNEYHEMLEELDYSYKEISSTFFDDSDFRDVIKKLELSDNNLVNIPSDVFNSCLNKLLLDSNSIKEITFSLKFLEYLNLSDNKITSLSGFAEYFPLLKKLIIIGNKIKKVDSTDLSNTIILLNLSDNNIETFNDIGGFFNLEVLRININPLTILNLRDSRKINRIYLSRNTQLGNIQSNTRSLMDIVRYL